MKFNADEIASVIQKEIETFESSLDVREVGTVLELAGQMRLVDVFDPDGNRVQLAQHFE